MEFRSINPATGVKIASYDTFIPEQIEEAVASADKASRVWRDASFEERGAALRNVARILRRDAERYATLITVEMGKPLAEARAEIEKCAWCCDFFGDHGAAFLQDEQIATEARRSYVAFHPLGVVLAVMPWNFPFWQVFRFAAPALMAGNTGLLKHAPNVTGCALAIEEVFRLAGLPNGALRALVVDTDAVGSIIDDRRVAAVTLTGSVGAGRAVAALAGRALKKTVLELGGSDPFIVLEDADMAATVETAVRARYQNGGQSCIAAKRFIVVDAVAEEFEHRFATAVAALRVGDPLDPTVKIGPMARQDLRDAVERQVKDSIDAGARILCGGEQIKGDGWYYEPTVLARVTPSMPAFQEEVFGPVAAVIRAVDENEAVALANQSDYGLGGNIWTRDDKRGERLARRIESGSVFVNGMTASDPRLPFGGVKHSGYGRELSYFGLREFTNVQTIWVGPAAPTQTPSE